MSVESVVRKIERQFHDLNKDNQALTVDGVPVDRYLNYFVWDEAKHPHRRPLPEIVNIIQTVCNSPPLTLVPTFYTSLLVRLKMN